MSRLTDKIWAMAEPVAAKRGCDIWDVEYVKEAGQWFLRVYVDKGDEPVSIDDCEGISRELDKMLDEADPIAESYVFEVSSAGAERQLKRPGDFERFMGSEVELRLYKPENGVKAYVGRLAGYSDGDVAIEVGGETRKFEKKQIAAVRLHVTF